MTLLAFTVCCGAIVDVPVVLQQVAALLVWLRSILLHVFLEVSLTIKYLHLISGIGCHMAGIYNPDSSKFRS